jgi:opacity protein-like surface antigen
MRFILFLSFYFLAGCATKYIVPGNRFITPETQGGALRGQFEFQQTTANQLTIITDNGTVDEGVNYIDINRSGFLISNSFFEQFDLFWSHTGTANSMLGGKFQFVGGSRTSKATGHKLSLAAAIGGNEHETDDESVEFKLGGQEFLVIYGYRLSEHVLPYTSFSYATYSFSGTVKSSDPVLNGLEPELQTTVKSLSAGMEFSLESFFAKVEATYQQLSTSDTKDRARLGYGYSFGFSW